jgi:hypothetical protein
MSYDDVIGVPFNRILIHSTTVEFPSIPGQESEDREQSIHDPQSTAFFYIILTLRDVTFTILYPKPQDHETCSDAILFDP